MEWLPRRWAANSKKVKSCRLTATTVDVGDNEGTAQYWTDPL